MNHDVIIVGAGPAGTSAAYRLVQAGLRVLLLDRTAFPRPKPCAGGLTLKSLKLMPYSIASVLERSTPGMTIGLKTNTGAVECYLSNGKTICTFAVRSAFDKLNFDMATEAGADFTVVDRINHIANDDRGIEVQANGTSFRAKYLIGADGANGVVRRLCLPEQPVFRGFALEGIVAHTAIGKEPDAEIYFGEVEHGYGWLFPKGDHVNVGIYSCDDQVALSKDRLRQYCRSRLGTDRIDHMVGYPLGFGGDRFKPNLGRIVLVGDAGGFAEPLLGEGLHNAIKTGQQAAQAIIDTDANGGAPTVMSDRYDRLVRDVRVDVSRCRRLAFRLFYPNLGRLGPRALNFPLATSALLNGFSAAKTMREITNTFLWSALYRPATPQSLVEFENTQMRQAA